MVHIHVDINGQFYEMLHTYQQELVHVNSLLLEMEFEMVQGYQLITYHLQLTKFKQKML